MNKKKFERFENKFRYKLNYYGYESFFLFSNFTKAYHHRVNLLTQFNDTRNQFWKNYLFLINKNHKTKKYFNLKLKNFEIDINFNFKKLKKTKLSSVLLIGPSTKLNQNILLKFETLIILKPLPLDLDLSKNNIILILNNIFSKTKSNFLLNYCERINCKKLTVFTPNNFGNYKKNLFFKEFKYVDKYGTLMGLQRCLVILDNFYVFYKLKIIGFNYGLGKVVYHHWYPSLISKNSNLNSVFYVYSLMKHDILFNILVTQYYIDLFSKKNLNLSYERILKENPISILKKLEKKFR